MEKRISEKRNYGLDLLKILSILFVILLHYNNGRMGGLLLESVGSKLAHYTEAFAIIACNAFVIISGYNLCKDNKIKIRKIVDIILLLVFYGIVIYIFAIKMNLVSFNKDSFKLMLVTINSRWFIDIYILLYLIHPFLNKIIENISKEQLRNLILICLFFFSLWSSILRPTNIMDLKQFVKDSGYGITNFMTLYLVGAYIKLYKDDLQVNKLLLLASYVILAIFVGYLSFDYKEVFQYNFLLNEINAILLFLLFKNLQICKWGGDILSKIASTSLAVYIIHENKFIVKYIYRTIFKTTLYYHSDLLIPHIIFTVFCIFAICVIIELIRKFVFKKTIDKLLNKIKFLNKKIEI